MRKTKKQLLGLAGLAAVIAMTAVACSLPVPDAAAESMDDHGYNCDNSVPGKECASADNATQIQVVVSEGTPDAKFGSPRDGSTTLSPDVDVTTNYSDVVKIEYYVIYKDADGNSQRDNLNTFVPTADRGMHSFKLDASKYGYGTISIHSKATGSGGTERTDVVTFNYQPILASFQEKPAENGDPILDITANDAVDEMLVYVYDKAGKALFVDEKGKDVPVKITRDMIDPATGRVLQVLPFAEYHAKNGTYNAVVMVQNADGELIYMATVPTEYKLIDPNVPEVPDSGIVGILSALNITRLDYLLTGLLVFGLAAVFALLLVRRKSRR